jgi:hypothetical protein
MNIAEDIRQNIISHLSINIKEKDCGFNGRCITIELKYDNEVISSDSYTIKEDEG